MSYYPPIANSWRHLGFNVMTANSTAKTLTDGDTYTIPVSSQLVRIQPEDANIRWRADGTSPTASTGNLIAAGDSEYISGRITTIEVIRATGTNAAVNVNFEGRNL
jgi:hypothetical protein